MNKTKIAVLIGNSDGIGLKVTHLLLESGYQVTGLSKSAVPITNPKYCHFLQDVTAEKFKPVLQEIFSALPGVDLCIYFVGIGDPIKLDNLAFETKVFQTNLMGAVIATEVAITEMLKRGSGHFIGLSSIADIAMSSQAPSYAATKAGISRYWEGLGFALIGSGVKISNIRLGFVDTKMAKAKVKPFQMTAQTAAEFILGVVERPRIRATKPLAMSFLVWLFSLPMRFRLLIK